ncbi:MAG: hypothetical protein CMI27_05140 [Opitutae bacterium]|nr:hypothetical protein [Opitutae bacterium]
MNKQIFILLFLSIQLLQGADFHAPAPFSEIIKRTFSKSWTPQAVTSISNRSHVLILDAETKQYCLSVTEGEMSGLKSTAVASFSDSTGSYGSVMRSMFQMQDINIESQASQSLSGTYTLRPELKIYFGIDANTSSGSSTSTTLLVNRIKGVDLSDFNNPGHLVFTFSGVPSAAKAKATSRYIYDSTSNSLIEDSAWSANQWLKLDSSGVELVNSESQATNLFLATAFDLIDFSNEAGKSFNPSSISWQTNSFASWPTNPSTGQIEVSSIANSPLAGPNGSAFKDIDANYQNQFGTGTTATAFATAYLDQIEAALKDANESLRYSKQIYLKVRENMLSHTFAAVDEVNAELGEYTVPFVYFTNAQDDAGKYHPFMVLGTRNGTGGPNFLIDVARPPGDGISATYETQSVTRNATLSSALFRIPLKDYGITSSLLENNMSSYNSLAQDAGIETSEYDVYNYASFSVCGIAVDGVKIYPAYNNTLVFAPVNAEISSTGIHVGRGMGLHYHADGHGFNGNGINLYNLEDYMGRSHPPVIGFALDGLAIFGKYENLYPSMDGFSTALDDYGSHDHDDYGHHYHAFSKDVNSTSKGVTTSLTQHFFMVGAYRGNINSIPDFQNGGTNQLKDPELGKYVGVDGTYITTNFAISTTTPTSYEVLVTSSSGGSVTGGGTLSAGSSVTLQATADNGYSFDSWGGDANGSTNPLTLTVDGNFSITASFLVNDFWSGATQSGNGWYSHSSFGNYYPQSSSKWLFHEGMGWLYSVSSGTEGVWLYMVGRGWLFTGISYFPFLYDDSSGNWVYYALHQDKPSFYEYTTGSWAALE